MASEGPEGFDSTTRVEVHRLRTEIRDVELRLMERIVRLGWLWVAAIYLASLALAAVIFVAVNHDR